MNKDIVESLTFIFENCDDITVLVEDIGNLVMDEITTHIESELPGQVVRRRTCNVFAAEIKGDAVTKSSDQNKQVRLLRLLEYNDITSIFVNYINCESEEYRIDWESAPDCEESNLNQSSIMSTTGNIYVKVCRNRMLDSFFDLEEINASTYKIDNIQQPYLRNGEIEFSGDSLPEFYRYVRLKRYDKSSNTTLTSVAVRVPDKETGWKFIYPNSREIRIPIPDSFLYIADCTMMFYGPVDSAFRSMQDIIRAYPKV